MNRTIFLSSEKIEVRQTQPNVQGVEFLLHPHNFISTEWIAGIKCPVVDEGFEFDGVVIGERIVDEKRILKRAFDGLIATFRCKYRETRVKG